MEIRRDGGWNPPHTSWIFQIPYSFVFYKYSFVSDKSMLDLELRHKSLISFRQNNDNSVKEGLIRSHSPEGATSLDFFFKRTTNFVY